MFHHWVHHHHQQSVSQSSKIAFSNNFLSTFTGLTFSSFWFSISLETSCNIFSKAEILIGFVEFPTITQLYFSFAGGAGAGAFSFEKNLPMQLDMISLGDKKQSMLKKNKKLKFPKKNQFLLIITKILFNPLIAY